MDSNDIIFKVVLFESEFDVIDLILNMYITMLPVIAGGILNMIFTKTAFYKKNKVPIDKHKVLGDGKRIFGDNKTWIGFVSMIVICSFTQIVSGLASNFLAINNRNDLYLCNENTILFNLIIGALFGTAYMVLELPNSFIKRRIGIDSGKTNKGLTGVTFFVIDQVDSLFGVIFVLYIFSDISICKYFGYILLGGLTHTVVNFILLKLKVRKNL